MTKRCLRVLGLGLIALSGFTQEFRATVTGRVLDSTGSAVPNVTLHANHGGTGEVTSATTSASGIYTIPFLRPGQYTLTAEAPGFKKYNRENITLEVGKLVGIDISLEVGGVTETIIVTAEAALLETQTASRGGVVNTVQVSELPLNARNPFMLGAMMSGVTFRGAAIWQRPFDNGAIAEWSVNGGRQRNNEFLLDGAPNNAQAGGNNIAYVPIVDAVQEFNVQSNSYDAAYGRTGGGVFNVVLKSGANAFHATGWEFLRNKVLDANAYQNNAVGAVRPAHTLHQYGFQLEGPVYLPKLLKKDGAVKLFYVGSFENYREDWPQFLRNSYPEPEMRNGDFSKLKAANGAAVTIYDPVGATLDASGNPVRQPFAGNIIPQNRIHPVARAVTAFMPLPNAVTPGVRYSNTNRLNPEYAAQDKFYNLSLKFDWNFGDKHRVFFRHASNDRTEDRCNNDICDAPGQAGQQPFQRINDAYVADWVWTATPTTVINIRASSNRFIEKGFGRANVGFDITKLGIPSSLISQLPSPVFFGVWAFNGYTTLGRAQDFNFTNNYGLLGSVTKIKGSHTLKFGADLRRIHYIQQNSGNILSFTGNTRWTQRLYNQGEATSGDGYASFLLGILEGSSNYPLYPFWQNWYFSPFFQDDWKVSRRLSLNLGLRWDFNQAPMEKYNRANRGFDPTIANPAAPGLKGGLLFAGVNGQPRIFGNNDFNNFQPRIGAAYQVTSKLVMRGGYGLYYLNPNNDWNISSGFSTSTELVASLDGNRTPIINAGNPYPSGISRPSGASLGAATFVGRDSAFFDPTFRTPRLHSFSFGFQYQVARNSTLDFSYVGTRTRGANMAKDYNIPSLAVRQTCNILEGGSPGFCNAQLPNPYRGNQAFLGTNFFNAATLSRYQLSRPFPQFDGNMSQRGRGESHFWYNSLQINYNQRLARGMTIFANYTFSKTVELSGYNDAFANVKQQGLYFNDRPHVFKFVSVYELPFGKSQKWGAGRKGLLGGLISGWEVTGFYNQGSGEPNDLPGNVIQLKDPMIQDVDWKAHQVRGFNPCTLRIFDDGRQQAVNCAAGSTDYYWLRLPGYAPRSTPSRSGQIRKQHAFTLDSSLLKTTHVGERFRFQLGFEAFNLLNHYYYGRNNGFNTNPDDPNFGTVFPHTASNENGSPRYIQVRMKIFW